jgi:hypothetical protein
MRTWSAEEIKTEVQVEMEIGGFGEEVEGGWEGDEWCSLCRRETNRCTLGREGYLREEGEKLRKIAAFVRMSATISAGDVMRGCVG